MKSINNIIPKHLKKYIVKQDYNNYNEINQSTWKFIMKISIDFFKKHGHSIYVDGLKKTGISLDTIPKISDINNKLSQFGWSAVPVRGFIPPNIFMEFQSLKILPIATNMRTHKHLTYTPAPDILHEAAGHAPIIANKDYSRYLTEYGQVASKAIMSSEDMDLYYAIRALSDIKEKANVSKKEITLLNKKLTKAYKNISYTSESSLLSRMNWWTVEYGLVGDIDDYKIYGAGLLSSVEESENCLIDDVKKLPFSIDCINYKYDITEQQPQLFIARNFRQLSKVLKQLSNKMSFKIGGVYGLEQAIKAKTLCSIEIDHKIQISGIVEKYITKNKKPIFIKTCGKTQLCYNNKELKNHGVEHHQHGYSSPIGKLKEVNKPVNKLSNNDLVKLNIKKNKFINLEYDSGIILSGKVKKITTKNSTIIIIKFNNCTVKYKNEYLFMPEWGDFDLICGELINSVYGGVADKINYDKKIKVKSKIDNSNCTDISTYNKKLNKLHSQIKILEKKYSTINSRKLFKKIISTYPEEWLVLYELLALTTSNIDMKLSGEIKNILNKFIDDKHSDSKVIKRGLYLIK